MSADDVVIARRRHRRSSRVPGMPKPDPILVADGVRRQFGGLVAVDVEHVEIQRGQITALIGPNGAGKTTFFNLLTGFDEPDDGTWRFDGRRRRRCAGLQGRPLGHGPHLPAHQGLARLSVMREHAASARPTSAASGCGPGRSAGCGRRQEDANIERADSLLERFKLGHMRDEFAGNLSGGQRKLLEMARALMTDPTLIMLDEPMAGVNPALKQSLLGHIKELKNEGRTVLFVEHDMDMVHEISDWVLVMAEGRLIAEGTSTAIAGNQDVIDAYLGAHHDVDIGADRRRHGRSRSSGSSRTARALEHLARPDDERDSRERVDSTAAAANVIEATEVVAGYVPEVNILNGCNLTVAPGEFVGIIGPNGAGKSTLLKAILGMVAGALGHRSRSTATRSPGSRPTSSSSGASASSPRPRTCSRP